jgi:hypothetical protein
MAWGLIPSEGRDSSILHKHPEWLYSPPGLLFCGYWVSLLREGGVKWLGNELLTTVPLFALMVWKEKTILFDYIQQDLKYILCSFILICESRVSDNGA